MHIVDLGGGELLKSARTPQREVHKRELLTSSSPAPGRVSRSQTPPARSRQSYRHEAFLWRTESEFTDTMVAFVEEGLAADEPVMVALVQEHADWLKAGLGADASLVTFVDMEDLGHNPARIIPGWQDFLDRHSGRGRPTRGIGEPIWAGRGDEEISECQLHEALLNVALDPQTPFWLVCPYDSTQLDPSVITEASRSHPAILDQKAYRGSTAYGGRAHVDELFSAELPRLSGEPTERTFDRRTFEGVFALVTGHAYASELWSDKALDLATAARQVAASSLHRGAQQGTIRIWDQPHALICEVRDATVVGDVLAGRRATPPDHDYGLWSANQRCDLVQLRSNESGSTVRLHSWK